ncbi:MAG: glycosyltransferase [Gemmataceae bacterium]
MTRICFLIDRLTRGGTETQLLALIRALDRSRFAPSLVLLDGTDADSMALVPTECPVLRLGLTKLHRPTALAAAAKLVRFWRDERVDLVQAYFLDSVYFGVPLARVCGVKRIVRVRNNVGHWLTPRHRALGRVMARMVDATLTNCEPARQAILDAERGDARKVIVLENGVDLTRFESLPTPPRRARTLRVGVVANLRPVKGIDVFTRAAALIDNPAVSFAVAGEGEQRPELERLIADLGLDNRFRLIGNIADVPSFLANLDVVVLPSHAEGMSNAILEAMAAGRPVVATDVGANAHLLGDGAYGMLVPPGDPAALADAIRRLLVDPVRAQTLGDAGRRHVRATYSRDAMRRRFERFYERLCA